MSHVSGSHWREWIQTLRSNNAQVPMEVLAKSLQLEQEALKDIPGDQVGVSCRSACVRTCLNCPFASCGSSRGLCRRPLKNKLSSRPTERSRSPSDSNGARSSRRRSEAARSRLSTRAVSPSRRPSPRLRSPSKLEAFGEFVFRHVNSDTHYVDSELHVGHLTVPCLEN